MQQGRGAHDQGGRGAGNYGGLERREFGMSTEGGAKEGVAGRGRDWRGIIGAGSGGKGLQGKARDVGRWEVACHHTRETTYAPPCE